MQLMGRMGRRIRFYVKLLIFWFMYCLSWDTRDKPPVWDEAKGAEAVQDFGTCECGAVVTCPPLCDGDNDCLYSWGAYIRTLNKATRASSFTPDGLDDVNNNPQPKVEPDNNPKPTN